MHGEPPIYSSKQQVSSCSISNVQFNRQKYGIMLENNTLDKMVCLGVSTERGLQYWSSHQAIGVETRLNVDDITK